MRKTVLTFVVVTAMLALTGGAALAAVVEGNDHDNRLIGTGGADQIRGPGGNDLVRAYEGRGTVYGGQGDDTVYGGDGRDRLYGGNGFDQIAAGNGNDLVSVIGDDTGDFVDCGPGKDMVNEMPGEQGPTDVYKNCEIFLQ